MDLSKYVRIISYKNKHSILVNSINNAIVLVQKEDAIKLRNHHFEQINSNLLKKLKLNDFFISNEKANQVIEQRNGYSDRTLTLTVNMTEGCNLNCDYCYQNEFEEYSPISKEAINQIVDYVEAVFQRKLKDRLIIYYFGGEPTTRRDRMLYLKDKIDALQKKFAFGLTYKIGSNGVLLKRKLVEKFDNLVIDLALSNKKDHDSFRTFKSGKGTYDLIIRNLQELKPLLNTGKATLNIRFNTNDKNINCFEQFVNDISKLHIRCSILPAYTDNYPYNNYYNHLNRSYYRDWVATDFINILIKYKQPVCLNFNMGPSSKCRAYEPYSIKFFSDGALALCDATDFYDRKYVPLEKIVRNPDMINRIYQEYKGINNKDIEECQGCPLLFTCTGDLYCKQDGCIDKSDLNFQSFIRTYVDQCIQGNKQYFVEV